MIRFPIGDFKAVVARAIDRGWVKSPTPPPFGFSKTTGAPRKYRRGQLSRAQYMRLFRSRLYAAGKTARGTEPKRSSAKANQL